MKTKRLYLLIPLLIGAFALFTNNQEEYIFNEGYIFGTSYHISYNSPEGVDYGDSVKTELMSVVDQSLSTFNKTSIISLVNNNQPNQTNEPFERVIARAREISTQTNGAFDMTVAPLVNLWGFGYTKKQDSIPDSSQVQELMEKVGYQKITIENHTVVKQNEDIKLDASAIAKGFGVDVAAEYLESKGISDFMVEIGGEVRVGGKNKNGNKWRLGIDKPIDDTAATHRELDTVIHLTNMAIATSGNYRQFYYKDGKRYSHTVDPKTGYPVQHQLLSATVIAKDCMSADAIATACMVMGVEKSLQLAEESSDFEVYLIMDNNGTYKDVFSTGMKKYLIP